MRLWRKFWGLKFLNTKMKKLLITITLLASLTMTTSCALLVPIPWQISTVLTAGDIVLISKSGKSGTEYIAEEITSKECQWIRILHYEKPCMNKKEYLDYLIDMNCKEYGWNLIGLPECKGK